MAPVEGRSGSEEDHVIRDPRVRQRAESRATAIQRWTHKIHSFLSYTFHMLIETEINEALASVENLI